MGTKNNKFCHKTNSLTLKYEKILKEKNLKKTIWIKKTISSLDIFSWFQISFLCAVAYFIWCNTCTPYFQLFFLNRNIWRYRPWLFFAHSGRMVVCWFGLCSSPASLAVAFEHPIPALHVYPTFTRNQKRWRKINTLFYFEGEGTGGEGRGGQGKAG